MTFPESILASATLSPHIKHFLQTIGLPREAEFLFGENFALLPLNANLQGHPSEKYGLLSPLEHASHKMFLIGYINYQFYAGDTYFCIEEETGIVRAVVANHPIVFFVNEDVRRFAEALTTFQFFMKPGDDSMGVEEEWPRLRFLKKKLSQSDAKAFSLFTKHSWWRTTLKDAADQIGCAFEQASAARVAESVTVLTATHTGSTM